MHNESHPQALFPTPASPAAALVPAFAALLPLLLARTTDMLAIKDLDSQRYLHVNAAMADFLGCSSERAAERAEAELFETPLAAALRVAEQTALAQRVPLQTEHSFEHRGERQEWRVLRAVLPPVGGSGRLLASIWTSLASERQRENQLRQALLQIEQQQRANDALRLEMTDQALRDPASGLYRRAHFDDQLRREVDLSTREHREFALVLIEIDPPQAKLRALGAAGERPLIEAAGRLLRSGTRAMDASCRYGEHQFAVLLSGVGLATAHARMEGLRRKCAAHIAVHEGHEFGFSVAMGVASFPHTAQLHEALLQACTTALLEARRRGGNQVTLAAIPFAGEH